MIDIVDIKYNRKGSKMERAVLMNRHQKLYEVKHDHNGKKRTLRDKRTHNKYDMENVYE
jgi:hypothetical protein